MTETYRRHLEELLQRPTPCCIVFVAVDPHLSRGSGFLSGELSSQISPVDPFSNPSDWPTEQKAAMNLEHTRIEEAATVVVGRDDGGGEGRGYVVVLPEETAGLSVFLTVRYICSHEGNLVGRNRDLDKPCVAAKGEKLEHGEVLQQRVVVVVVRMGTEKQAIPCAAAVCGAGAR
ncbi:hypothetical protein BHM03_00029818 [Ensete ventricosum]|nr:hypothetical protein BHM03_00029818 [Ensete ventricosum]